MKKELDDALVRDFPLLYRDRHASSQETCMCWGFPNDGWEPLIRELSSKLEPLIQQTINANPNLACECGHRRDQHGWEGTAQCHNMDRQAVYTFNYWGAYSIPKNKIKAFFLHKWKRLVGRFKFRFNQIFQWIADKTIFYIPDYCKCNQYHPAHPRASQVKEKYGTLRFYMTSATDEMWNLISEYEQKSASTCEACGKSGKLYTNGWYLTLCPDCAFSLGRTEKLDETDPDDTSATD